jgi:hypothetical protein
VGFGDDLQVRESSTQDFGVGRGVEEEDVRLAPDRGDRLAPAQPERPPGDAGSLDLHHLDQAAEGVIGIPLQRAGSGLAIATDPGVHFANPPPPHEPRGCGLLGATRREEAAPLREYHLDTTIVKFIKSRKDTAPLE